MRKVTKQELLQLAKTGNTLVIVGDDFKGSILDYAPIRNRVTMVTMVEEHNDFTCDLVINKDPEADEVGDYICPYGSPPIEMPDIGNYYGGLQVWEADGKFFWCIEDWDSYQVSHTEMGVEIPESLYKELLAHFHKDKPERDREEEIQEAQAKAQAAEFTATRVAEAQKTALAKQEYRKNNPICDYATPALMLQGYYDGHVDREAMLRTFDEASVYHVVCDVTGMITLGMIALDGAN